MSEISKNNLRNIRILTNPKVSQWKLALLSQVPQSRISLIENHLVSPNNGEVLRITKALKKDVANLFPSYKKNGKTKNKPIESIPIIKNSSRHDTEIDTPIDNNDKLFKIMEDEEAKKAAEIEEDDVDGVEGINPLDSLTENNLIYTETEDNNEEEQ